MTKPGINQVHSSNPKQDKNRDKTYVPLMIPVPQFGNHCYTFASSSDACQWDMFGHDLSLPIAGSWRESTASGPKRCQTCTRRLGDVNITRTMVPFYHGASGLLTQISNVYLMRHLSNYEGPRVKIISLKLICLWFKPVANLFSQVNKSRNISTKTME